MAAHNCHYPRLVSIPDRHKTLIRFTPAKAGFQQNGILVPIGMSDDKRTPRLDPKYYTCANGIHVLGAACATMQVESMKMARKYIPEHIFPSHLSCTINETNKSGVGITPEPPW